MGWMIFAGFCMVAIIVLFGWLVFISSDYGKAFAKKHSKKEESKKQKKAKQQNSKKSTEKTQPVAKPKIETKAKTKKVEHVEKSKTKPIVVEQPKPKKIRVIPVETKWEDVWTRTVSHQGEVFFTKMGIQFVYRLEGNESLIVSYPNDKEHILGKITKTKIKNAIEIIKK